MPLKTLLLNPPSFENFDGGASSRWPATREIESYWYPVWLTYPAGLLEGSRVLDALPASRLRGRNHQNLQGVRVPGAVHLDDGLEERPAACRGHQSGQSVDAHRLCRPAGDHRPGACPERVLGAGLHLPPRVRLTPSSSLPRASRSTRFSASATRRTARSSTIPTARRWKTWTRCPGPPKSTSATWT